MPRKPLAAIAASAITVLVAAGLALAHGGGPASIQATSATFDATTVSNLKSDTCTGADGTYTRTRATYTGNAVSTDANLNGTLTLRANTVYNADTTLGVVDGKFRVETATGHTDGHFRAVDTNGTLAGWAEGHSKKEGPPDQHLQLLGTLSVTTFDAATGFTGGQLGAGSSTNTAVFVSGHCPGPPKPPKPHGDKGKKGKHGKHGHH